MPRAAGGRKSCSSSALPTGKCECRLASSDEAPAEGVKVGERCGGQRLDIWLEEIDKAIIVNPDVFRQWKGDATDRSIAEQSLPRKLADLAQVVVNNLSMRSGSAANVRISAESQINTELARLLDGRGRMLPQVCAGHSSYRSGRRG